MGGWMGDLPCGITVGCEMTPAHRCVETDVENGFWSGGGTALAWVGGGCVEAYAQVCPETQPDGDGYAD